MDETEEMLDAERARAYLAVSRATFYSLVRRFRIQKYAIPAHGRRRFFKKAELDKLKIPVLIAGEPRRRRRSGRPRRAD